MRTLWLTFGGLAAGLISGWLWPGFAHAELSCWPTVLYRGDTLTVDLPAEHEGFDFAILGYAAEWGISFEPTPKDRIAPVIAPEVFAKMKQVKLVTSEARGSLFHPWRRPHGPIAIGPPKLIFIRTLGYEVMIGPDLGALEATDIGFEACHVKYFNYLRPNLSDKPHR